MQARDIVGRTIARIVQQRTVDNAGSIVHHLDRIYFTDGTWLSLSVAELECDYAVLGTIHKASNERPHKAGG